MPNKTFIALNDLKPGPALKQFFDSHWAHYQQWFLCDGERARPTYLAARMALEKHMPEMVPLYEQLLVLFECNDIQARFFSQYNPPAFAAGCSQLIWNKEEPALVRNYDYPPHLNRTH